MAGRAGDKSGTQLIIHHLMPETEISLDREATSGFVFTSLSKKLKSMNPTSQAGIPLNYIYQDAFCKIGISESKNCIYQYYHQLPESRDLMRSSMEVILSLAKEWSVSAIAVFYFLEVEEGKLLPSEDITWVRRDVIPQLADAGIRFLAYVSQNNLFRQFSHDNMQGSAPGRSLSLRVFQDRQDALEWLQVVYSKPFPK